MVRRTAWAGWLSLALTVSALGTLACRDGGSGPAAEVADPGWNVVFVLVDTLRADHLGAYGYERDTSPVLDALAAENVLFTAHRSQAPCTFPSVNSLLTSRSPQVFEYQPRRGFVIPEETPALPEILRANGYATMAVSASAIVRATPSRHNPSGGYGRGFDVFRERCLLRGAACINNATWEYLPLLREPFFLYLHFMDPHAPYDPPDFHERRFGVGYTGSKWWAKAGDPNPVAQSIYSNGKEGAAEWDQADIDQLVGLYDDSIRFFDSQLGLLLGKLEERGVLERTLLVVLGDHGESFLENGHLAHCRSLHETEIRTPLVMKIPSRDEPMRVEGLTSNLDVVPTVLDYLGLQEAAGTEEFEGVSLRPAIERGEPVQELVFGSYSRRWTVTDGRYKLIVDDPARTTGVYDLAADPGEQENVIETERRVYRRLADALSEWRGQVEPSEAGSAPEDGETTEDRLKALGYL